MGSIINTNHLKASSGIISVCMTYIKKHTNTFCGQNEKFRVLHLYAALNKAKELVYMPVVYHSFHHFLRSSILQGSV